MLNKIIRFYFLILPFAPFIAYYTYNNISTLFYYNYGFVGFILLLIYFFTNLDKFKFPKYLILLIFLFFYYFIWDLNNGRLNEVGIVSYIYRNVTIYTIVIILLIENTNFDKYFLKKFIGLFKITIILGFCFSLYQVLIDYQFFFPEHLKDAFRTYGTNIWERRHASIFAFLGSNELGVSFLPLFSLYIGYYNNNKRNLPFYLFLFMGVFIAVASNARYVLLSLVIVLMQLLLIDIKFSKVLKTIAILSISFYMLLFLMQFIGYNVFSFYNDRVLSDASNSSRINSIFAFFELFPNSMIFGTGREVTSEATQALQGTSHIIHVGYLLHLYAYGIIGSFFLFTFWFLLIKKIYLKAKQDNFWGGFFAFLSFFAANLSMFYFDIFTYGLILSLIFYKNYKVENK